MPQISIIVPVYNVEPFIRDCLDSIQKQDFKDWECILVNDGSTDGSGSICRQYCKNDSRFRYIHQKNAGVSAARNAGLDVAQGDYFSFVDPDDCIADGFFSIMLETMKRCDADIVSGGTLNISENDNYLKWCKRTHIAKSLKIAPTWFYEIVIEGQNMILDTVLNDQVGMVCWSKLYKSDLWQGVRFPENVTLGEDTAVMPEIIMKAKVLALQTNAIYFYRARSTSLSKSGVTLERFRENLAARKRAKEYFTKTDPGRGEAVADWILKYNALDLIAFSTKKERSGSALMEMCKQSSEIEEYKNMNTLETLQAVFGDVCRFYS